MCDCGCDDGDDEEDEGYNENDNLTKGRDEHGLVIELRYEDGDRVARSRGFLDFRTNEKRMELGIPSFPLERDIWVTTCEHCGIWVFVPLDELGAPSTDLLEAIPTRVHCQECHQREEWEQSHLESWDLARDQTHWENCNQPDEDFPDAPEEAVDEHEDYLNLLRFELEYEHGPIGCRSRPFPTWELYHELIGEDIGALSLPGGVHLGRCYTCAAVIVAPVAELRSSIEDRLGPTETIIRCQKCHDRVAWENQELDAEEAVQQQATFVKSFGQLMKSMIDDEEPSGSGREAA